MEQSPLSFRYMLRQACLNSTIQGVKYFYIFPGLFSRIFWFVNMITLLFVASYLTLDLWYRFIDLPTRIMIENQFAAISDIPFPAVTFCSPNQISKKRVDHLLKTLIDRPSNVSDADLLEGITELIGFYQQIPIQEDVLKKLDATLQLNRYTLASVLSTIPQQCDSFVVFCYWEATLRNCSEMFKPILTPFGYCCSFNSYYATLHGNRTENFKPKGINHYGIGLGVSVLVYYDKLDVEPRGLIHYGATKVFVHSSYEYPPPFDINLVPSGSESFVSVKATYTNASEDVEFLPPESRDCVFPHEASLRYFSDYNSADCDLDCEFNQTLQQCGCLPIFAPRGLARRRCGIPDLPCLLKNRANLYQFWEELLGCECPRECSYLQYTTSATDANMGAMNMSITNAYKVVKDTFGTSIIHIFFQNQFYVKQKQETVTSTVVIISNLGGVFGLCLGCSAISIVEVLFFFVKLIVVNRKICRKLGVHKLIAKTMKKSKVAKKGLQVFE